ncbi:MAG TPA: hypothetical protein VFK97_03110 [Candidatus Saccharimonadales bacterium]|nr:hypothetical protein [Candidatus Saccharimonadales bacterium]
MYEANLVAGQEEAAKSALVESIRADAPDLVIMAAMRLQTNALFARIEAEKSAAKIIRAEFERPESVI